jgi:phage baseplate assembly protein W
LAFPFKVSSGSVDTADDDQWVQGLIEQVLFTRPGERVNLPQFGCGVEQLVFQPDSPQLAAAVQYMVKSELQRCLSGIAEVGSIEATTSGDQLSISIEYVNLITGQRRRVTLPTGGVSVGSR